MEETNKACDDAAMEVDANPQDLDAEYTTVSETSCNTSSSSMFQCETSEEDKKTDNETESMSQYETSEEEDKNEHKIKSVATKTEGKTKSGNRSPHAVGYTTKLNYLFRDCRFFLMKSCNSENISLAKAKGVWSTLKNRENTLNHAVRNCRNVILIFSAEKSGKFSGFARLRGTARYDMVPINWVLSSDQTRDSLGGIYKLDWISRLDLSYEKCGHLNNPYNGSKPIKIGRTGQEIECEVGKKLCHLFPVDEGIDLTSILYKSKRSAIELTNKRALQASQQECQRDEPRVRERQQEHRFADRQRPYKRKDGRDYRPRMEERPNWSRRDEQHTRDRDPGLFVRGRWSVVYNRYVNCNVWRSHMPTNYRDRRHARVMNRSEEHFMRRGHDRDLRQTHHGRGGYTHAGGYRERCQHSYRHPYQR